MNHEVFKRTESYLSCIYIVKMSLAKNAKTLVIVTNGRLKYGFTSTSPLFCFLSEKHSSLFSKSHIKFCIFLAHGES